MLRSCLLLFAVGLIPAPARADEDEEKYVWGRDQRGLQAGGRLLSSSTGKLQPGDPIVVEFVLKNTSDEKKTLVVQQYDNTHPILGDGGRIELNILGSSQRKWQHILEPDQTLTKRQYRVTVSTEGLPPGQYHVTAGSAFWLSVEKNRGTGVGHGRPIPVTIGDPDATTFTLPKKNDDPKQQIHWGGPVVGLVVGARFPDGKSQYSDGDDVEADMFLFNATDDEIEVEYEIPAVPSLWNLHLQHESKQYVRLDSTWFSGAIPQMQRTVSIKPEQQMQITGIEAKVATGGGEPVERVIGGPVIALQKERTEFNQGDPKRLIGSKGKYTFHAAMTMRRSDIPDMAMVLSAGAIPFEANPSAE